MAKVKIASASLSKNKLIKGINKKVEIFLAKGSHIDLSTAKLEKFEPSPNAKYDAQDLKHIQTLSRLKHHKSILNSLGITDFMGLGEAKLQGKISPSVGVFTPSLIKKVYHADKASHEHSRSISGTSTYMAIEEVKARSINARIVNVKTWRTTKVRKNSVVKVLPSIISNPVHGITARSVFPIGQSYILANTLRLDSYTNIIIDSKITDLIIIADQIITSSSNINITWNQPSQPAAPEHGTNTSRNGSVGAHGNKGADGHGATPNVEIWTLNPIKDASNNIVSNPLVVNLKGQDGLKGGKGQKGGIGRTGQNGDDGVARYWFGESVECKSGPRSGGQGGNGGTGGDGGQGGNGGPGGDLNIYTLSTLLTDFSNTILLNDGGQGGASGSPGAGGQGGQGGRVGAAPGMCANTNWKKRGRVNGAQGRSGARGRTGARGDKGDAGDLIQLNPITAAIYNQTISNPGIVSHNPIQNTVGEAMSIHGVNFSASDKIRLGGITVSPVFNNTIPNQIHTIAIPDIEGGYKSVEVVNALSNTSNVVRIYIRASIGSLSHQRIKPGKTLTVTGTGFSPNCGVFINNQAMANVTYVDKNTLEVVVERPNAIVRNPDGETVVLNIVDNYNNVSNTVNLVLDTYRILTIGDSIMAGQGHDEADMFSTMLENHIQGLNPGIGVYETNLAHSGATIEDDALAGRANEDKEVPRAEPSIKAQLNRLVSNDSIVNEDVELIVLDGAHNDVGMMTYLQPEILPIPQQNRLNRISGDCTLYGYHKMKELLAKVATEFPNAKVLVMGYYQVISEESKKIRQVSTYVAGVVPAMVGMAVLSAISFKSIALQSAHVAKELNRNITQAVADTNSNFNTSNFKFVDTGFNESNSIFADDSFLWEFSLDVIPEDPLADRRRRICNDWFCRMASVAHPNDKGVAQYFKVIKAAL